MVQYGTVQQTVYYHTSTTNKSFLAMANYLRDVGIERYNWMLVLFDPDLARIDPFDPNLPQVMKMKVLRECIINPIYFIREIVRIPDTGDVRGVSFELSRGNMALLFCLILNLNIYLEMPRQTGKTISALAWYLWVFNFGTSNSEMSFLNKKLDESKLNLQRLRDMRALLPSYLRMDTAYNPDGTKVKVRNNVETIMHPVNANKIRTVASAANAVMAASLLRGRTTPIIYCDEYGFIKYNKIIYINMVPAFNTASINAKNNHKPYGMLITSTPGMLTTDEGLEAYDLMTAATPFSEKWYDLTKEQIYDIIGSNGKSNFVYIRYTYQQLGKSEKWFKDVCIEMRLDWAGIRREILLEWSVANDACPFSKEDLDIIKGLIRQPIRSIFLLNKFEIKIYMEMDMRRNPPIMGVDVSGGYQRDSSAITVIDSATTCVAAEFNCNYISPNELAALIFEMVTKFMPNCVVNIERNGGFGASVISRLLPTVIKRNLFFTIKDKIVEERISGAQIHRRTQKTKIYGSDSTKSERDNLMEILRDRVSYHKDKIFSETIYNELCGMEQKKNGKIEHSNNTHDDQIFSWLWALYVYYYGGVLLNDWGITVRTLRTDADMEEAVYSLTDEEKNISEQIDVEDNPMVDEQLKILDSAPGKKLYEEWMKEEQQKDQECLDKLLATKLGREAYERKYNTRIQDAQSSITTIPQDVFTGDPYDEQTYQVLQGNMARYW